MTLDTEKSKASSAPNKKEIDVSLILRT